MRLLIEISSYDKEWITNDYCIPEEINIEISKAIANGIPIDEEETKLKRRIEKDIEMLNEIIESGWLISDLEQCPAIDACEDAIKALKQYPVLDKVRAEIEERKLNGGGEPNRELAFNICLQIIDKYRGNVDEI